MSDASSEARSAQEHVMAQRGVALVRVADAPLAITADATGYAGLVTRSIAFALDAAIVNGCALLVGVIVGLGLSVLHLPGKVEAIVAVAGGALWVLWSVAYFAFFWSSTGQTPGDRVMRIRVVDARSGGAPGALRSIARFGAVILAALPLLAGFLMMLWDSRRRCLQDRLTLTVVVDVPVPGGPLPGAQPPS